jgi:hypothetical protein
VSIKEWEVRLFKNSPVGACTSDFNKSILKSPGMIVSLGYLSLIFAENC